ncbi:interleukin-1 receptor-associated kinase 4-like [Leptidea sinapis]|uniref:interleukin-1 receptor-associated kinase 4-like n=1 Tax=Leptidea sinapis TaxID=189913 RepID=UPI002125A951|nr:interleukin-1 receptor-associated kinase 4-like [Leptidea sinapis]
MNKNIELRKLPAGVLCNVINILETNNDWKKFMANVPKDLLSSDFEPKYNNEHIRIIEEYAKETNQKCTEILFDEWGTSGKVRPTLQHVKEIALKTQIYRAADEIAIMLQEPLPQRPKDGPAAPITTNITEMLNDSIEQRYNTNMEQLCDGPTLQMKSASDLIEFSKLAYSTGKPISSEQVSIGNKTTVQMKSESDLIEFSKSAFQTELSNVQKHSMNIPNLSVMISEDQDITLSSKTISTTNTISSVNYPDTYQQSFPNINISDRIDSVILQDEKLIHFDYRELQTITNNFSENLTQGPNGPVGRIGSGGFGDVFVGCHSKYGTLAVKKIHDQLTIHRKPDIAIKVFNAEVKFLSHFRHKNILPILGFSKDGPIPCIVSEYIDGGSLQEKIAAKVLSEKQRIEIMIGTAEGLKYLHTNKTSLQVPSELQSMEITLDLDSENSCKNFVHGDVKSANILLTSENIPKLCDFGLAKQYDSTAITTYPMGTSAYMAPEGLRGTITQKIDIFSFGIVLLELLTGLKPIIIMNGDKLNINDYVEENYNNDINSIVDPVIPSWIRAKDIFNLAQMCLQRNRKDRPTMDKVYDTLVSLKL